MSGKSRHKSRTADFSSSCDSSRELFVFSNGRPRPMASASVNSVPKDKQSHKFTKSKKQDSRNEFVEYCNESRHSTGQTNHGTDHSDTRVFFSRTQFPGPPRRGRRAHQVFAPRLSRCRYRRLADGILTADLPDAGALGLSGPVYGNWHCLTNISG